MSPHADPRRRPRQPHPGSGPGSSTSHPPQASPGSPPRPGLPRSLARRVVESPEGTSPSGAHGTGRERLRSSGSSHRSLPPQQRPVCKQSRGSARNPCQPVSRPSAMASQPLELTGCPQHQLSINLPERRIQRRLVEGTVIVDPSPDLRIEHARQIVQSLVAAQLQPPAPHFLADRLLQP